VTGSRKAALGPSGLTPHWSDNCAGVAQGRAASLPDISAELAVRGIMNERGNAYSAASIR